MPKAIVVRPGDRYQSFTIIEEVERKAHRHFKVKCELCGSIVPSVSMANLRAGKTSNCWLCGRKSMGKKQTIHGDVGSEEYKIHQGMMTRCYNKKDKFFKDYGGRGITVCDRWHTYSNFLEDILRTIGRKPGPGYSIDRINNEEGYRPGNVTWSTNSVQQRNTRRNIWIVYKGTRRRMIDVCEELNLPYMTVNSRRHHGWAEEDLFLPIRKLTRR
jgi:hypothetical protein